MMSLGVPRLRETLRCPRRSGRAGPWRLSFGVALVLLLGVGCSSKGLGQVTGVLEALGDPTESVADLSEALVRVLDAESRQAVAARAARLTAEAGVPVGEAHVLQARGLSDHRRVAKVEVEASTDDTATLVVHLAPLTPAPGDGQLASGGPNFETVELVARREEGQWRLSLRDLAPLIGRLPITAERESR